MDPSADQQPARVVAARAALRQHWRHDDFRPGQREIVEAVLGGEDVLAVLPTGGGKSVCYQVPAIVLGGLTIVVSPLIALMQDQVAGLRARGVPATFITSQLSSREIEQRWTDAEFGLHRLLYVAPERFRSDSFRHRAERLPVRLLAVDEAHCISEWGPDFRPSYRQIDEAAELLGRPPVIAVTATATPEVRRDIVDQLALRQPRIVVSGFDRPNVVPSVFRTSAKLEKLLEVLAAVPGTAVVYVATRAAANSVAGRLAARGIAAAAYHAGMSAADRISAQEEWQSGKRRVIVATNAFGMGIDKPDVRAVIHMDVPLSVEAYYQEAGRAGRDGRASHAVLLFAESDEAEARAFVEEARPDRAALQAVYDVALSMAQVAIGSTRDEPFVFDAERVASVAGLTPMAVRAAGETLVREGVWEAVRVAPGRGLIHFLQSAGDVSRFAESQRNARLAAFVQELLRCVPGEAFHQWTELDAEALGRRARIPAARVLRGLDFLAQRDLLAYHAPGDGQRFRLLGSRVQRVQVDGRALSANKDRARRRLDDMIRYARAVSCRRHFLLSYFGEATASRCGSCDVCLGRHRPQVVTPDDEPLLRRLLEQVASGDPSDRWLLETDLPPHRIVGLADWLVNEGYMRLEDAMTGSFALTGRAREFSRRS